MTIKNTVDSVSSASSMNELAGNLVLENVEDSFVLLNQELAIVYFNKAAKEYTRRFLNIDLFHGMNAMKLVRPHRKEIIRKLYADVLQGHRYTTENSHQQADGKTVYFENQFLPVYIGRHEIAGIVIASKNITDLKKAKQVIQDSEERLQIALEATHQGAWDWNLKTNEIIYSSSYKKLYGFDDHELKNHISEWMQRIHPDDKVKMKRSLAEHLQSANPVFDSQYRIQAKNGTYYWIQAKGRLIRDEHTGEPLRMIGTHTDVTDTVEKEMQLKQFNDRFKCIIKATHELLWEWDIQANKAYRPEEGLKEVYGMADNRSIKTIDDWLQRVHPDDRQKASDLLQNIMHAAHQQTFELEYRFRTDNGTYNYIYDRAILLWDDQNRPARLIGSAQDVTERKRLENEILNNELAYQRMIHQAIIESQEKERAEIGKELHDNVNQVLTTTKLYLDLAQSNPELNADLIAKSLTNINNVIQEIRHLSHSLINPSIGDLGLLDSLYDLIENIHFTQKLNVELTASEAIEELLNPKQKLAIFRIIQESLSNVLRHAKATNVNISITREQEQLHIAIQDNGIGFKKENLKKGAGLKNIQNRIYLINGTLHLESQPDKGCLLQIQFPIK